MAPQMSSRRLSEISQSAGLGGGAKQWTAGIVGVVVAATVGAIFNWSWWVEYALIAPSAVWWAACER
jgi:hypothetical protein